MKKTKWIVLGLTLVISITVYVNWWFTGNGEDIFTVSDGDDCEVEKVLGQSTYVSNEESEYFTNARYLRKKNREDAIAVLNQLIDNENADKDARNAAAAAITEYARSGEREASIENLIMAKGFEDCIVYLGADNVSVVVEAEGLEAYEAAQIMDIVATETKFSTDVIKIIEISSIQN